MANMFDEEKIMIAPCDTQEVSYHKHDFLELVYVTKGSARHVLNGNETTISRGNYFIVDYGAHHKYFNDETERFQVINCLFTPDFIDRTLVKCRSFNELINNYLIRFRYETLDDNPTSRIFFDRDNTICRLMDRMAAEYHAREPGYLEILRCNLIELIILTMRTLSSKDANIIYNDYSSYILKYIGENYMKRITLTEICRELNFSVPYLSKKFKCDTGISFQDCLQRTRIEQSCRLLANTDKKIVEIARLVGYADIKFFNRVFKRQLNVTPYEFKKMLK